MSIEDRAMGQAAEGEERSTRRRPGAERLLGAASDLFYREGIRAVGVDTVSERAGVSKRTLYNRFGGKDELIAEYLRRRDERWKAYLRGVTEAVVEPGEKLLAVFEAYEEWLVGEDFRGCAFANAVAEIPDPDHPARVVARRHKEGIEEHLAVLAKEAGFDEPRILAERLLLLLEGAAATAAMRRSHEPLGVARSLAQELLDARSR
jgi:AcrR family transcriptional regulator